ncbi:trafficking protein particle complex subunit 9 isoform X2 [Aplysia californica]|uniref:Trafficking protein particle complex subunit 9 isoform X2 n=1 Tax=Aplysia californica TaxID=6500 RepID=A0ABM0JIS6_APLCA|nr:trafficking protein particle complex subunit 9 isoform X2 [Aplysia californica]
MMQYVDYNQTAEDHQSLLVLVLHVGSQLHTQQFHRAMDKISRVDCIHVQGQKRNITVRYKKNYSVEFNSWGDFQTHRKVLGLIAIGKCADHTEFEDLFASYKSVKEEYAPTIINSRLVVFGMNTDGSPLTNETENVEVTSDSDRTDSESVNSAPKDSPQMCSDSANPSDSSSLPVPERETSSKSPQNSPAELKRNGVKKSSGVANNSSSEKRSHSNSLTKEGSGAEIVFYPNLDQCADLEERIKEFVTSLYYVLEGKRLDRSFERSDKLTLLCAPFEKKDYVGVDTDTKSFRKKCMGRLRKHLGDLCLQAAMPGEAVLHYNTALDLLRGVNDFLWMGGCFEGMCCAAIVLAYPRSTPVGLKRNLSFQVKRGPPIAEGKTRAGTSYANGLDVLGDQSSQPGPNLDDVVEKYKEAITYYSKFKHAAVVEMEACLKACRLLILQRKYLQASDFLQNVVYINLPSQEDDRIQRYNTLSALYSEIGFRRKAAFFKRVSGMHCVAPDSSPSWSQCYELLLQSLEGYSLSVNPREMELDGCFGWPVLQYRVLHELVYSARRMSNPQIAVRHMTLLVHLMLRHLSVNEQREALTGLSTLTLKCPGTPQPLALDTGLILPPVPLLALPTVRSFRLLPPAPHLQATKIESPDSSSSSGVFIYTPLSLSNKAASDSKPDFKWVCGDVCEASLQLLNPLADELKIFYMGLMTSDEQEAEIFPANPVIPADSGLMTVKLMVRPKSAGTLKILGYTTIVYGVKSNCRLRDLVNLRPSPMSEIVIEVIPPLPHLALCCSLPKATVFSSSGNSADVVASGSATLFAGQSMEGIVTVQNTSDQLVEKLSVRINSKNDVQGSLSRVVSWVEENITSQLPIETTGQLCFSLYMHGDSDFLQPSEMVSGSGASMSPRSRSESAEVKEKSIDTVLSLQYSGGEGLTAGYCRQCSLALNIDILPSVYITRWDLQNTNDPQFCRLCLDLVNVSGHQMDLSYASDSSIVLEPHHTRRIGLEVPRLDAEQVDMSQMEQNRIPAHYRTRASPDPYSQCLARYVDIKWTMPSTKATGTVGIDYLTWTPEQLRVLLLSDIRWEVKLCGQPLLPSSRFSFQVGETVEVAVRLENTSDVGKKDSLLCIEPCQRSMGGDLGLDCSNVSVIGASVLHIAQIAAGSEVKHSCSFLFLAPGSYGLTISCRHLGEAEGVSSITVAKTTVSAVTGAPNNASRPNSISKQKSDNGHGSTTTATMKTESKLKALARHTWVYSSPVRFEVT